jgi:hypothetical protein
MSYLITFEKNELNTWSSKYISIYLLNSNRAPNNYLIVSLDEPAVPEGTAGEAVIDAGARSSAVLTSLKRVQKKNKCV